MIKFISTTAPWRIQIRFRWPSGRVYRERRQATVSGKDAAKRQAERREAELLAAGEGASTAKPTEQTPAPDVAPVPTLREFGPRWIDGYAKARRQKASGIDAKESILRNRIYPKLGDLRLDEITPERLARFQASLSRHTEKTLNNTLSTLGKLLKVAVEWGVIDRMPCTIRLVKARSSAPRFLEIEDFQRLVVAAGEVDSRALALVLLGGHGGLRRGELIGLRWSDVDFKRRQIHVWQAVWRGVIDTPKSGKPRAIDMSSQLEAALRAHPRSGDRVLCADDGSPATAKLLRTWLAKAAERAGVPHATGALHVLRHTCGASLSALGAPPRAIQDLLGHADLTMTMRYMSMAASTRRQAVDLFDLAAARGQGVASLDPRDEKA